jgi:hypothetical protein
MVPGSLLLPDGFVLGSEVARDAVSVTHSATLHGFPVSARVGVRTIFACVGCTLRFPALTVPAVVLVRRSR